MNDAQVQAQSCATPANDESVGVARTNAMLKQGDTFCVFELGSVPEGTKLYTRPPKQEQSPKVAPTVAIDERAEFEKWANKHKGGEPLQLGGGGTYTNPFANAAYEAWQAARKLSAPEVLSKTTDTVVPDDYATPTPADTRRLDFIEANPDLRIYKRKKLWSVGFFSNYERDTHKTLREAIDEAMLKGEK